MQGTNSRSAFASSFLKTGQSAPPNFPDLQPADMEDPFTPPGPTQTAADTTPET
jgi:hypothetical protein